MKTYRERTEDILEKAAAEKRRQKTRRNRALAGVSCSLAAVLVLNLALFLPRGGDNMPPMDGVTGAAEDYTEVQERLSSILGAPSGDEHWTDSPGVEGDLPQGGGSMDYRRIADGQTEGVTEGNLLAQGGGTAFYLTKDYRLQAYSIAAASLVGELAIKPEDGYIFRGDTREMYLSEDLSSATVFTSVYDSKTLCTYTAMIGVETKNPATMSVTGVQYISGRYITSRKIGGNFLAVSQFNVFPTANLSDEREYIPQTGVLGAMKPIPAAAIFLPDEAQRPAFTVVSSFSEGGELLGVRALLSFTGEDVYISQNAVYTICGYYEKRPQADGSAERSKYRTDVVRVVCDRAGGLTIGAKTTVGGKIEGPFSMDEYGDTFRVFATTGYVLGQTGEDSKETAPAQGETNVSLFIYDAKSLRLLAGKEGFAQGGSVCAARFDGDRAYVCTASPLSAPLLSFDLADLGDITCTASEEIPGFSVFLTKFTDGLLLGIKSGTDPAGIEVELCDEGLQPVAHAAIGALGEPEVPEAYYIGREYGLIGFAAVDLAGGAKTVYFLFRWDGEELAEAARIPISCSVANARAFFYGGSLYLFDGSLKVFPLP